MRSILSIGVIAICVAMYFVYIKPMTVEVKARKAEKEEYTKVLTRVDEIKIKRDTIIEEYNSIPPEEIDRLNKIIPEKINSVSLLNDLSVLGSTYGIVIKDFKVADPDNSSRDVIGGGAPGSYKTSHITMSIVAQYEDFLNFLEDIEYSLSLLDVVNINILPGSLTKSGAPGPMQITLEANTYSLR